MLSSTERGRRYRARLRGEDVPKLRPGRKADHLIKAYAAIAEALDHIAKVPADDLEKVSKR